MKIILCCVLAFCDSLFAAGLPRSFAVAIHADAIEVFDERGASRLTIGSLPELTNWLGAQDGVSGARLFLVPEKTEKVVLLSLDASDMGPFIASMREIDGALNRWSDCVQNVGSNKWSGLLKIPSSMDVERLMIRLATEPLGELVIAVDAAAAMAGAAYDERIFIRDPVSGKFIAVTTPVGLIYQGLSSRLGLIGLSEYRFKWVAGANEKAVLAIRYSMLSSGELKCVKSGE